MEKDYYRILSIEPTAAPSQVSEAINRLTTIWGSNIDGKTLDPKKKFKILSDIREASHVLSNPERRMKYDSEQGYRTQCRSDPTFDDEHLPLIALKASESLEVLQTLKIPGEIDFDKIERSIAAMERVAQVGLPIDPKYLKNPRHTISGSSPSFYLPGYQPVTYPDQIRSDDCYPIEDTTSIVSDDEQKPPTSKQQETDANMPNSHNAYINEEAAQSSEHLHDSRKETILKSNKREENEKVLKNSQTMEGEVSNSKEMETNEKSSQSASVTEENEHSRDQLKPIHKSHSDNLKEHSSANDGLNENTTPKIHKSSTDNASLEHQSKLQNSNYLNMSSNPQQSYISSNSSFARMKSVSKQSLTDKASPEKYRQTRIVKSSSVECYLVLDDEKTSAEIAKEVSEVNKGLNNVDSEAENYKSVKTNTKSSKQSVEDKNSDKVEKVDNLEKRVSTIKTFSLEKTFDFKHLIDEPIGFSEDNLNKQSLKLMTHHSLSSEKEQTAQNHEILETNQKKSSSSLIKDAPKLEFKKAHVDSVELFRNMKRQQTEPNIRIPQYLKGRQNSLPLQKHVAFPGEDSREDMSSTEIEKRRRQTSILLQPQIISDEMFKANISIQEDKASAVHQYQEDIPDQDSDASGAKQKMHSSSPLDAVPNLELGMKTMDSMELFRNMKERWTDPDVRINQFPKSRQNSLPLQKHVAFPGEDSREDMSSTEIEKRRRQTSILLQPQIISDEMFKANISIQEDKASAVHQYQEDIPDQDSEASGAKQKMHSSSSSDAVPNLELGRKTMDSMELFRNMKERRTDPDVRINQFPKNRQYSLPHHKVFAFPGEESKEEVSRSSDINKHERKTSILLKPEIINEEREESNLSTQTVEHVSLSGAQSKEDVAAIYMETPEVIHVKKEEALIKTEKVNSSNSTKLASKSSDSKTTEKISPKVLTTKQCSSTSIEDTGHQEFGVKPVDSLELLIDVKEQNTESIFKMLQVDRSRSMSLPAQRDEQIALPERHAKEDIYKRRKSPSLPSNFGKNTLRTNIPLKPEIIDEDSDELSDRNMSSDDSTETNKPTYRRSEILEEIRSFMAEIRKNIACTDDEIISKDLPSKPPGIEEQHKFSENIFDDKDKNSDAKPEIFFESMLENKPDEDKKSHMPRKSSKTDDKEESKIEMTSTSRSKTSPFIENTAAYVGKLDGDLTQDKETVKALKMKEKSDDEEKKVPEPKRESIDKKQLESSTHPMTSQAVECSGKTADLKSVSATTRIAGVDIKTIYHFKPSLELIEVFIDEELRAKIVKDQSHGFYGNTMRHDDLPLGADICASTIIEANGCLMKTEVSRKGRKETITVYKDDVLLCRTGSSVLI